MAQVAPKGQLNLTDALVMRVSTSSVITLQFLLSVQEMHFLREDWAVLVF